MAIRTPSSFSISELASSNDGIQNVLKFSIEERLRVNAFSPCGKYLALYLYSFDDETNTLISDGTDGRSVQQLEFSPGSSFLCVYTKILTGSDANNINNCYIWSLEKKEAIYSFLNKNPNNWTIHWTKDEKIFGRISSVHGELSLTDPSIPNVPTTVFKEKKLISFSISPSSNLVAVHFRGGDGALSFIKVYSLPNGLGSAPRASRGFSINVDTIEYLWSPSGNYLVAFVHSDTDQNGKSYYGHDSVLFLNCSGKGSNGTLDVKGPIYNVSWSPIADELLVIFGNSPAQAKLFDGASGRVIFDFGLSPKNLVKFNRIGNLICFAGLGNLSGLVELWDRVHFKRLTTFQAPGTTTIDWSPNGKYLLLATLSPRLRVDNGIKVFDYAGNLIYQHDFKELLQANWLTWRGDPFKPFEIDTRLLSQKTKGIRSFLSIEEKSAYVPPSLRKSPEEKKCVILDQEKPTITETKMTVEKAISPREKLIKNIQTKLKQIGILKKKQAAGEPLELNQVDEFIIF